MADQVMRPARTLARVAAAAEPPPAALAARTRWGLAIALAAGFAVGYFALAHATPARPARAPWTPLDRWLAFVPGSIWVYASAYPMAFAPILLLRDPAHYRRTLAALAAVIAVALPCFAWVPVDTGALRADAAALEPGFTAWAVRLLYALDPPRNAWPSLHVALGAVLARSVGRIDPRLGRASAAWLAALAVSAATVKQHFAVDVVAGLLLGAAAEAALVRGAAGARARPAALRRGLVSLACVAAAFHALLFALWRAGSAGLLACLLLGAAAASSAGEPANGRERMLHRLAGRHFSAVLRLRTEAPGWTEERLLTVWRDDEGAAHERVMARFDEPADLRGVAVLYFENPGRGNDYFLYQPRLGRVRRIPESLARENVFGLDLEYMGFGAAQIVPTELADERADVLDGRPVIRFVETAREPNARFDRRVVWIDPASDVPLRMEHERGGAPVLVARTLEVAKVDGIETPMRMIFERAAERTTLHLGVERIDYRSRIPEEYFSTLRLVREH